MIIDIIGILALAFHFSSPLWINDLMDYIEKNNKSHIEAKKHD